MKKPWLLKNFILKLFVMLISSSGIAQSLSKPELYKITHTPPDATAMAKYGEYPVSLYHGTPNIQVPVYEINCGRIKIPIGISYHAGGLKIEEIASSVGLGWSLNGGGALTRNVRGTPDDVDYEGAVNYFTTPVVVANKINPPNNEDSVLAYKDYWKKVLLAKIDGEPDIYYYNFGNYSGKFLYHQADGKFYSAPYAAMRIEYEHGTFTITDENGIVYTFSSTETSIRETSNAETLETITTWYLDGIYDPINGHSVNFTYAPYDITYEVASGETHYMPLMGSDESISAKQNPNYHLRRLKEIAFDKGRIVFEHNLYRCDLPGDSALTGIKVYNYENTLIKNFTLDYDYFYSNPYETNTGTCSSTSESVYKRLKLLAIHDNPVDGSGASPLTHSFEYNSLSLPHRFSFSQDHWGFYNGKSNAHLYLPYSISLASGITYLPGGNREIDTITCQANILTRINFPTGGHTDFTYESNRADNGSLPPTLNTRNKSAGGPMGGDSYTFVYFSVSSTACSANGNNGGAYIQWEMFGLDLDMINTLGFPGISAKIDIINVDSPDHVLDIVLVSGSKTVAPATGTYYLPNGNYKLVADFSENPFSFTYDETQVNLTWTECNEYTDISGTDRLAGGIRIKKITSYTDDTHIANIKSYKYNKESNPNLTSGQTHFIPQYISWVNRPIPPEDSGPGSIPGSAYQTRMYLKRTSSSSYPLVNEAGKAVGYSNVIEMDGENGENGYTQYKYTNYSEYDDFYNSAGGNILSTPTSYNWLRGLELEKKVYQKTSSGYSLVAETLNQYDTTLLGNRKRDFKGIIGTWTDVGDYPIEPGVLDPYTYYFEPLINTYTVFSDFVYLKNSRERLYNNGSYLEKNTTYTYNPLNLLPAITETVKSDGTKEKLTRKYPLDFEVTDATNPKSQAIYHLQGGNYISPAIEQYSEKEDQSNNRTLKQAILTSFKPLTMLPDTIFAISNGTGIANYTGATFNIGNYSIHGLYTPEVIVEKYDGYQNIIQQKNHNNISISYIWDYQYAYPVCEVKNAVHDDIAYTSFEAQEKGNWTYSAPPSLNSHPPTGNNAYDISNAFSKSGLTSGTNYIVSYWRNSNAGPYTVTGSQSGNGYPKTGPTINGWTYYEHLVTGVSSTTISGTGLIDEVRLYPRGAQMTTYTFAPLTGMTSQCDVNNRITYYEYDGFGRLKLIRDENKNVLKTFDYQYQKNYNQ